MKKLIFMLAALSFSAVLWGQAISDQSFLDGRRTFIGEPLGTFAQAGSGNTTASTSGAAQNQDVGAHLNAQPRADEQEINFEDTSSQGILRRLQFLEFLHGLSGSDDNRRRSDITQGFIPQKVEDDKVIIIGYRGTQKKDLTIPVRIDERDIKGVVIGIGPGALANLKLEGEITFEDGTQVATIYAEAFANNSITNVVIPDTVTLIENGAFSNNQLISVTIPSTLDTLAESVFANNLLPSVSIPESVTTIKHHAFSNNKLANVTIPRNVTQIDNSAFENNKLATISLPVSIAEIGDNAFAVNDLTNLDLSKLTNLTKLNYGVFSHNHLGRSPGKLILSPATTEIGDNAFSDNELATVTIPKAVETIGKGAFSVNKLKDVLFEGNTDKQAITAQGQTEGASVTEIGAGAFAYNQLSTIAIPNSVIKIDNQAFLDNQLTRVIIGENVDSIGIGAFQFNNLTTVTIPNNVTKIGALAFAGADSRQQKANQNKLTSVTLGEGVEIIGEGAFANNLLRQLAVPNQVKEIGERAFENNQIAELVLGKSVSTIRKNAFNNNKLTSLVIPDSCQYLLEGAFTNNQLPKEDNAQRRVIIPGGTNARPYGLGPNQRTPDGYVRTDATQKAFDPQTRLIYL